MAMTYVCSPLSASTRAEMMANAARAGYYMSKAEQEFGDRAVAPHAVLPYILDVFGSQISSGMDQEIRAAQNLGIPIFYRAGLQESLKCTEVVT